MISGLGITEIGCIVFVILVFFGPKELPALLKQLAKLWGKFKFYQEKFQAEMREITRTVEFDTPVSEESKRLNRVQKDIEELSHEERVKKSAALCKDIVSFQKVSDASVIAVYLPTRSEVLTDYCIKELLLQKKRVVVFNENRISKEMSCFEIADFENDIIIESESKRSINTLKLKPFLFSDVEVAVVPSLLCDSDGRRMASSSDGFHSLIQTFREHVTFLSPVFKKQVSEEKIVSNYSFVHHLVVEE